MKVTELPPNLETPEQRFAKSIEEVLTIKDEVSSLNLGDAQKYRDKIGYIAGAFDCLVLGGVSRAYSKELLDLNNKLKSRISDIMGNKFRSYMG